MIETTGWMPKHQARELREWELWTQCREEGAVGSNDQRTGPALTAWWGRAAEVRAPHEAGRGVGGAMSMELHGVAEAKELHGAGAVSMELPRVARGSQASREKQLGRSGWE